MQESLELYLECVCVCVCWFQREGVGQSQGKMSEHIGNSYNFGRVNTGL